MGEEEEKPPRPGGEVVVGPSTPPSETMAGAEGRLSDPGFAFWIIPMDTLTHKIVRMHIYVGNKDAKGTVVVSYKLPGGNWIPLENICIPGLIDSYQPSFVYDRCVFIPRSRPGTYIFRGEFKGEWPWKSVTKESEKVEVEPETLPSTPTVG